VSFFWVLIAALVFFIRNGYGQEKLPPGFVKLNDVAPSIRQDIRYAGAFNFTGQIVAGYESPQCILWHSTAKALAQAQAQLASKGFDLKVYDCYRPIRAVQAFVAWSKAPRGDTMKSIFYPGFNKSQLFALGFISSESKHSFGNAVDVGLVRTGESKESLSQMGGRCDGPFDQRARESSLDFGTAYDCFSNRSATASPQVSAEAHGNRERLREALEKVGFRNYSREWWHFERVDRTTPIKALDFPVQ